MKTYSIYALTLDNIPFYIGQSKNLHLRIRDHRYQARWTNPLLIYRKIRKIWRAGKDFEWKVLERNLTLKEANEREKFYIKWHKDLNIKLYNLTDGGDGNAGHKCSEEIKRFLSKLKLGKSWGKHSQATKLLLSAKKKGIKLSKPHCEKLSEARRRRIISLETRKKCSETSKGKINIRVCTLISPDGKEFVTSRGLTCFCEEHGLTQANLAKVVRGKRPHHKGWRIKPLTLEKNVLN